MSPPSRSHPAGGHAAPGPIWAYVATLCGGPTPTTAGQRSLLSTRYTAIGARDRGRDRDAGSGNVYLIGANVDPISVAFFSVVFQSEGSGTGDGLVSRGVSGRVRSFLAIF